MSTVQVKCFSLCYTFANRVLYCTSDNRMEGLERQSQHSAEFVWWGESFGLLTLSLSCVLLTCLCFCFIVVTGYLHRKRGPVHVCKFRKMISDANCLILDPGLSFSSSPMKLVQTFNSFPSTPYHSYPGSLSCSSTSVLVWDGPKGLTRRVGHQAPVPSSFLL